MDDDADHAVFRPVCVGAIGLRTSAIETDHRILHPDPFRVHGDSYGIWVIDCVLGIGDQGLGHGLGAVLLPKGIALLGIKTHGKGSLVAYPHSHGVPHEFSAGREGKIPHIARLKYPGLHRFLTALLRFPCLFLGHDEHRFVKAGPRLFEPLALGCGQHRFRVDALTCCSHNVIGRHRQFDVVVSEVEGEFTAAQKLFVLPTRIVAIDDHARVELGDRVEVILVLLEVLIASATTDFHPVIDVVPPTDVEDQLLPRQQGLGQVHPHHRVVDDVGKRLAGGIGYLGHLESPVKRGFQFPGCIEGHPVLDAGRGHLVRVTVEGAQVLV